MFVLLVLCRFVLCLLGTVRCVICIDVVLFGVAMGFCCACD